MQRLAPICACLLLLAAPAWADGALTDSDRAKVLAAMAREGCTGGTIDVDDGIFEVDDATCGDGRVYDLKFDPAFKLIDKDLEH
ncbi:PepSY domain-containing protein [Xanthobacter sp. DSM 24535]|uniref:PepSY domain-containing protein n=1 Tax=Roseixanthobacter psychrophilus TaxID=3119917 RepID=UPI00372A6B27